MNERYVVSSETGEILMVLGDGDRIVRKKSIESNGKVSDMRYDNFAIINLDNLRILIEKLSNSELAFIVRTMPYISYTTNRIKHSNGKKISTEDFVKITGFSRNKVYEIISSLIIKNVLYKDRGENGIEYYLNPYLLHRGNKTDVNTIALFDKNTKKESENNGEKE